MVFSSDFFDELSREYAVYEDVLRLVPIFWDRRSAKLNLQILENLALWGKMAKYDLVKKILEVEKLSTQGRSRYVTIKRRVDDLHSRGYLEVFGTRTARKRGDKIDLYGLSHKGRMVAALANKLVSEDWSKMTEHYLENEVPFLQELFKIFINKNANIMSWLATADYRCVLDSPNLDYYKGNNKLALVKRRMECITDWLIEIYKDFAEKGEYPEHLTYLREEKLPEDERRKVIEALEDPKIRRLVANELESKTENMEREIRAFQRVLKWIAEK